MAALNGIKIKRGINERKNKPVIQTISAHFNPLSG